MSKRNTFIEEGFKNCPGCNEVKHQDEYFNNKYSGSGKTSRCKECTLKRNKEWQEANPQKFKEAQISWRAENEGHTYLEKATGYVRYIGFDHPITNPSGVTFFHRVVLWDKIGPGDHECHWQCGKTVSWDIAYADDPTRSLVVDHLNGIRDDNRPENLVPSCQSCNSGVSRLSRKTLTDCSFDDCELTAHSKNLCKGHYMQSYLGKELKPLRKKIFKDENGKECSGCDEYKTWDFFYVRSNGKHQNQCKACTIKSSTNNAIARRKLVAA